MRRAFGWLMVVLLASGPAMQLHCAAACTAAPPSHHEPACHHHPAPDLPSLAGVAHHDCSTHTAPDGVTAPASQPIDIAPPSIVIEAAATRRAAAAAPAVPFDSGGPPGSFLVPQRI